MRLELGKHLFLLGLYNLKFTIELITSSRLCLQKLILEHPMVLFHAANSLWTSTVLLPLSILFFVKHTLLDEISQDHVS